MALASSSTHPTGPHPSSSDLDSAIRVTIIPSQAAYFAGEPFTATITFTNTRSPSSSSSSSATPVPRLHKRGAHSVSSAPLARPPTSPGTPRTAIPPLPPPPGGVRIARRGLIGKQPDREAPDVLEESRKRLLAKARSASVTIAPSALPASAPVYVRAYDEPPPDSTPYGRAQAVPANHPHARKHSVFDGQIQIPAPPQPPTPPPQTPSSLASASYPSSPATSTFSLALPPIAEAAAPAARALPDSDAVLILYAYAQLAGTLVLLPTPGPPEHARAVAGVRAALTRKAVVGGGSMDISSSQSARPHRRSTSFSSGLLGLLSPALGSSAPVAPSAGSLTSMSTPSLALSPSAWAPVTRPRQLSQSQVSSPSMPAASLPPAPGGGYAGLGWGPAPQEDAVDPEAPLPTFDAPQVMLAVDLALRPGESRSYTYTLALPAHLPPTFRGRALRFAYAFAVGTCRAGARHSVSRVMKVPIRVYTHVAVGRVARPYDLLWPVARRRAGGRGEGAVVVEGAGRVPPPPPVSAVSSASTSTLVSAAADDIPADLREYAQRLLMSVPAPGGADAVGFGREHDEEREDDEDGDGGVLTGCREAVEILTRTPKKASYDVTKDGVKVAELTFTKSAYRLGETVLGVVELNARDSPARVLSMSAMLETHESLPAALAPPAATHRRVLAEHHASFVVSSLRTTFALDIPSDAAPAFQVHSGAPAPADAPGGLAWKVRLCLLVALARGPGRVKHLRRDGPRGEWGAAWAACAGLAPLERADAAPAQTWGQYFAGAFLGGDAAGEEADGAEEADGLWDGEDADGQPVDFGGGRGGWRPVRVETVECEVPIKVRPGNTAFKAMEVVFDV
ncbi:hypothetical protein HWV62_10965 [Athelia sp. TMB]|nr:hypothetical protein HWV62_10965 [Athelia sp. TMB]